MAATQEARIGVVGAGAWGTAIAEMLARAGRDVVLVGRDASTVAEINEGHVNRRYLPEVHLAPALVATTDLSICAGMTVVVLVAPAQTTRIVAGELGRLMRPGTPLILCAKGLERGTGNLLSDVVAEVAPDAVPAVLSGPSFAADVVRGLPTALTLACRDRPLGERLSSLLGARHFRLYWTDDLIGVQLGGAVKNVLAIAAGIVAGRKLGASAQAALVTRGFAEMRRLAEAAGARAETMMGLSGLGDLALTCSGAQSRNFALGLGIGAGTAEDDGGKRALSEGAFTAAAVCEKARALGVDVPIVTAVSEIVAGRLSVDAAIDGLLQRPLKPED